MTSAIFTTACLVLLGQNAGDVYHTNQRNHAIPVNVPEAERANYREYLLYASADQGRTWQQAGAIPASKNAFAYYAPSDGAFWFQVATVNRAGVQDPDDRTIIKSPPHLKMQIDTVKPIIKSLQAQRQGDEIAVRWDVQEENPDLSKDGMRVEYQAKEGLLETWKPIPFTPGLRGQTSFFPATKAGLTVRLTLRDQAGNQSYSQAEVSGTVATAGFQGEPIAPVLPGAGLTLPKPPVEEKKSALPPPPVGLTAPIKSPEDVQKSALPPPPPPGDFKGLTMPPPGDLKGLTMPPPPPAKGISTDVVADSRTPPVAIDPPKGPPSFPPPGGLSDVKPLAHAAPARRALPMLQYVNQHQVKVQYEIKRQGPSGIGGIQIWLTKDDGESWAPYAEVKDINNEVVQGRQERDFEFRDKYDSPFPDGVYGLMLVVRNRAGLGREPRPGDAPEMRIEIDTKPPVAQLFKPVADPQNPTQLLLKWSAQDRNLDDTPIHLEYAEKRDGPWQPIELNLKNTGRYANQTVTGDYSWKIPQGTPVQVYLRLRVRDKAGNESVAVTSEPQYVDLVEPEGALIGVVPQGKRP